MYIKVNRQTDLNSLLIGCDVGFYGFVFLGGSFHGLEVESKVILKEDGGKGDRTITLMLESGLIKQTYIQLCCVVRYLGDQPLVLTQPRLPHGGLAVEASGELLQFLLANQLRPQSQLPLVLRLLQTLPRLKQTHTIRPS